MTTQRFPANVMSYVQERASRMQREKVEGDAEAIARHRGELIALNWLLYTFGISPTPPEDHHCIPVHEKPAQRTKREFIRMIDRLITDLEAACGFTSQDGWNQVKRKGPAINESYGVYDAIDTLMVRFDFNALARAIYEEDSKPSPVKVSQTTRRQAGECNFCDSGDAVVYEIATEGRMLRIRFCKKCLKSVAKQAAQFK